MESRASRAKAPCPHAGQRRTGYLPCKAGDEGATAKRFSLDGRGPALGFLPGMERRRALLP